MAVNLHCELIVSESDRWFRLGKRRIALTVESWRDSARLLLTDSLNWTKTAKNLARESGKNVKRWDKVTKRCNLFGKIAESRQVVEDCWKNRRIMLILKVPRVHFLFVTICDTQNRRATWVTLAKDPICVHYHKCLYRIQVYLSGQNGFFSLHLSTQPIITCRFIASTFKVSQLTATQLAEWWKFRTVYVYIKTVASTTATEPFLYVFLYECVRLYASSRATSCNDQLCNELKHENEKNEKKHLSCNETSLSEHVY